MINKPIREILHHLLASFEYEDLIFFCETAISEGAGSDTIFHYLALAYEHIGKPNKAIEVLNQMLHHTHESRLLFIRILFQTKRFNEIEYFIINTLGVEFKHCHQNSLDEFFGDYSGSAFKIIAECQKIFGNNEYYAKLLNLSLKCNPFSWSVIEKLHHARVHPDRGDEFTWPLVLVDSELELTSRYDVSSSDVHTNSTSAHTPPKLPFMSNVMKSTPLTTQYRNRCFNDFIIHDPLTKHSLSSKTTISSPSIISKVLSIENRIINAYKSIERLLELAENYSLEVFEHFEKMPEAQKERCYVLATVASTYFHLAKFNEAKYYFDSIMLNDPSFTYRMDECSSNLWQLKQSEKLQHLLNTLLKNCPLAFETWIVAGNLASLKNQSKVAVSYFKRATLLAPNAPYTYTILAQEKLMAGDTNSSDTLLKQALQIDTNHYPAWYYIAKNKIKLMDYNEAICYLKRALAINSNNTLIATLLGYCALKCQSYDLAHKSIDKAINLEPKNPLYHYEKAVILFEMKRYQESNEITIRVLKSSPLDSALNLLAAKSYIALKKTSEAISCLCLIIRNNHVNKTAVEEANALLNDIKSLFNADNSTNKGKERVLSSKESKLRKRF